MAFAMNMRIGCVILAAGGSRRFHAPHNKLVSVFQGKPLLQHAVDAAAGSRAMHCTVVAGANANEILAAVDLRRCSIVNNAAWKEGIAASIRCGLGCHVDDDACVFVVGDQPFIRSDDINHLIQSFAHDRGAIVALQASAVWGTPMLFPRADFSALERLRGDHGAKRYAQGQKKRLRLVRAVSRNAFGDVDSLRDLQKLQS